MCICTHVFSNSIYPLTHPPYFFSRHKQHPMLRAVGYFTISVSIDLLKHQLYQRSWVSSTRWLQLLRRPLCRQKCLCFSIFYRGLQNVQREYDSRFEVCSFLSILLDCKDPNVFSGRSDGSLVWRVYSFLSVTSCCTFVTWRKFKVGTARADASHASSKEGIQSSIWWVLWSSKLQQCTACCSLR